MPAIAISKEDERPAAEALASATDPSSKPLHTPVLAYVSAG